MSVAKKLIGLGIIGMVMLLSVHYLFAGYHEHGHEQHCKYYNGEAEVVINFPGIGNGSYTICNIDFNKAIDPERAYYDYVMVTSIHETIGYHVEAMIDAIFVLVIFTIAFKIILDGSKEYETVW